MDVSIWVIVGAIGVFLLFIAIYLFVMIVWPEWVGITGKVALEAERSHREGAKATGDEFFDKLHEKAPSTNEKAED